MNRVSVFVINRLVLPGQHQTVDHEHGKPGLAGMGLRPSRYATWPAAESDRRSRWRRARADGVPGSAVMNTTC